jgi:hypothetical protein
LLLGFVGGHGWTPTADVAAARSESAAHLGPRDGLHRYAIEFGDTPVHLTRPRHLGVLVHLGVETLQIGGQIVRSIYVSSSLLVAADFDR